jgi:hypothetical protein
MGRAFLVVAVVFLVLLGARSPVVGAVNAQATPAATPAAGCEVQPRTIGGINEIGAPGGTPVGNETLNDDAAPYVKPEGIPASQDALDGVTDSLQEFVACINAGDYLRFLSLFSDDFLRRYSRDIALPLDPDDLVQTPSPVPDDERASILSIEDVIEFSDGSVNALVIASGPDEDGLPETIAIEFALSYDADRESWLIDEFKLVTIAGVTDAWLLIQGEGYEGVIVPEEDAGGFSVYFPEGQLISVWTPQAEEIEALERDLPGYLQTAAAGNPSANFSDRLPEYKRQYVGIVENGRELILVNAFCTNEFDWQEEAVIVSDGGDCFFRVIYDPTTGSFEGFEVNGEA